MKTTPRRPSIALLLAGLALVVASGGASYAAGTIGTADLKDGAVTSVKVKDGTLTRADLTLGTSRGLGVGRAYALVDRDAGESGVSFSLDAARTFGFSRVDHPSEGTFCLVPTRGVDLSKSVVVTSVEYGQSNGVRGDVVWNAATTAGLRSCPVGQVEIITYDQDEAGAPEITDGYAFSVIVS